MNKILVLPDFQIPDHDPKLLPLIHEFIGDFKPDHVFLIGDVLNLTGVASYEPHPHYTVSVKDEVEIAKPIIDRLVLVIRNANPKAKITWQLGNHEYRLERFLAKSANALFEIKRDGEYLVSIATLFETRKLGIEVVPYQRESRIGDIIIEHGDIARKHSGYTARAMLDSRGENGISGHTHRVSYHSQTKAGITKWWIEAGSLCNFEPEPHFVRRPDWQQSFVYLYEDEGTIYPTLVPIFNHKFIVSGKLYSYGKMEADNSKREKKAQLNKTLGKLKDLSRGVLPR